MPGITTYNALCSSYRMPPSPATNSGSKPAVPSRFTSIPSLSLSLRATCSGLASQASSLFSVHSSSSYDLSRNIALIAADSGSRVKRWVKSNITATAPSHDRRLSREGARLLGVLHPIPLCGGMRTPLQNVYSSGLNNSQTSLAGSYDFLKKSYANDLYTPCRSP